MTADPRDSHAGATTGGPSAPNRRAASTSLPRVVGACFLGLAVSGAPMLIYTQGVFLGPMTEEFGWSRSFYFFPLMIGGLLGAVATVLVGMAADRQGVRSWLLAGIFLFGLLNFGLAALSGSRWIYGGLIIGLVLAGSAHGPLLYTKAISQWATRRPGQAIAVALAGTAAGAIITPPLATWLVGEWGWRTARAGLGAAVMIVALPAVWLAIWPPPPEKRSRAIDPASQTEEQVNPRQVFLSRRFVQLAIGLAAAAAALNGMLGNLPVIITDRGLPKEVAALSLSAFAVAQIFGRLLSGVALDRINTSRIGAFWFLVAIPGALLIGFGTSTPAVLIGAMLLGLSLGSELELAAYYTLRFFGVNNYGAVYGALMAIFTIGATTGPLLLGVAYDRTGANSTGIMVCIGLLLLTITLFLLLGRYRFALAGHGPKAAPVEAAPS